MLVLSTLHHSLSQVLSLPHLHTTVLLTPAGELVSFASDPARPKDDIRILVGLSGEIWQETRDHGLGMVESELGRVIVIPVDEHVNQEVSPQRVTRENQEPFLLLAMNGTEDVEWEELHTKGTALAQLLARPLGKYCEILAIPKTVPAVLPAGPTSTGSRMLV